VGKREQPGQAATRIETPGKRTIEEVSRYLEVEPARLLKTLVVNGAGGAVAIVLRGDHELNAVKAQKLAQVVKPLSFVTDAELREITGCPPGFLGPVGLSIPVVADESAARLHDFFCGANQADHHLSGVNWGRDLPEPLVADLRNAVEGDPCPRCEGRLRLRRGIEVGHVFQLGTKYSEAMGATCLTEDGQAVAMPMGCYGIGVSRIVAAAIEQHHDDNGILWPAALAPFRVCIVAIGLAKSDAVAAQADAIYEALRARGIEVLFDDRDERPGVMFADMDLIGIPHRLVIGDRGLKGGTVEYKHRLGERRDVPLAEVTDFITRRLVAEA